MNINDPIRSYPDILRKAGYQQTNNGLVFTPPGYTQSVGGVLWPVQRSGLLIRNFSLHNRSGGAVNCGIGYRYSNSIWQAGLLSANGATYTDFTTTAQSSTAVTTIQTAGADQTGFVILSDMPFGWVSVNITTAETNAGGATVVDHDVYYSQGASWSSALGTGAASIYTNDFYSANAVWSNTVKNFVWAPPIDWTKTLGLGGLPDGKYAMRFTSADREANDVAAIATGMEIGSMLATESLADNGEWGLGGLNFGSAHGDGVVAYFSTANAGNRVYVEVLPLS